MKHLSSYPSVYQLGHRAIAELFNGPVQITEKVDGCVSPDTLILMADLSYKAAGDLVVGDSLVGFDNTTNDPRLRDCVVTHTGTIEKECFIVQTTTRNVIASYDHPWLVSGVRSDKNPKKWITTQSLLRPHGNRKNPFYIISLPMWEKDESWSGGYIAGFYDGEGSLVHGNGVHNSRTLGVTQATGKTMGLVKSILSANGFSFSSDIRKRKENYQEIEFLVLRGGWTEILRFLGAFRPQRLLLKARDLWVGGAMNYLPREEVLSVTPIGIHKVVALSTSTNTYVANGLLCHNSQFSFGIVDGELCARSKNKDLIIDAPDNMFKMAIESIKILEPVLNEGWVYRGEYLKSPKHNTIAYSRTPNSHIILFDINIGLETYMSHKEMAYEAETLGLEVVPLIYEGMVSDLAQFKDYLTRESILGGSKVEGVVVKRYDLFTQEKKAAMGKYVREDFKEENAKDWKTRNPTGEDITQSLIMKYHNEARFRKAIQHLREQNLLEGSPKDIGLLIREVPNDILKEAEEEIKAELFKHFWPNISRGITHTIPDWYKGELAKEQFDGTEKT